MNTPKLAIGAGAISLWAAQRWRRLRGFDYLAKVIGGIEFQDGIEITEVNQVDA